jgi:general secretion pathway protein C
MVLVWLCYELADLSWRLIDPAYSVEAMPVAYSPATSSKQQLYHLQDVAQYHLFGKVSEKSGDEVVVIPAVVNAPVTRLNLKLRGLFAAENGAYALISEGSGEEQVYKVGMNISPTTKIESIYTDSVVLNRGGNLEVLYLEDEAQSASNALSVRGDRSPDVARRAYNPATRSSAGTGSAAKFGQQRARFLKNPQEAMRFARIQPVMQQGKLTGYRINPGGEPQLFDELGFKPGDLVKEVNGVAVDDPAKIGDLMKLLTSASQLNVTIERNGSMEKLLIEF